MEMRRFLDIRTHGFSRVAVCVPRVFVADPAANAKEHAAWLDRAWKQGVQYAVCPELGLTGYTCKDLFLTSTLRNASLGALSMLLKASNDWPGMTFSVGAPLMIDGMNINAASTMTVGRTLGVHGKTYLPNYGPYEEKRWFKPVTMLRSRSFGLLGQEVPVGNDLILRSEDDPRFALHVEICEDLWKAIPPSAIAALGGATVFANLSASNAIIGKASYRRDLVGHASAKYLGAYLYAAAGFGEDVSSLGWDGHGMIAERGNMLAETKRFVRDGEMIVTDLHLEAIVQDRLREETHADNMHEFRDRPCRVFGFADVHGDEARADAFGSLRRSFDPTPFVPKDPATLDQHCQEAFDIVTSCILTTQEQLPPSKRNLIGGISGGIDSTLMALFAAAALDRGGSPRTMLKFATLPGFGTSDETYEDACRLIGHLGAEFHEISIKEFSLATFSAVGHDPEIKDTVYENAQALARKHVLMALSGQLGGIVLGTGDLSEGMVGWCTIFADHVSHYHVNIGIAKSLARALILWMRDRVFTGERDAELRDCLTRICGRPTSPELMPVGKDGKIAQKTDAIIGPEDLRDFITYHMIRFGIAPSLVARLALDAFAGTYDLATIKTWQATLLKRFFWNQHKRSSAPLGPMIGSVSLDPRGNWRMPTAACVRAWLDELGKNVPE